MSLSIASRLFVAGVVCGLASLTALTGCSTSAASADKDDVESYESELRLSTPRYLGPIANGETKTSYYYNPPRYRAFGFYAKGGEQITADVKSVEGDGMGWITTSAFDVLAVNDDASSNTLDAKVVYTIPDGTPSRPYRIVFRDYDLLDASFSVKLSIASSAVVTCSYEGAVYPVGASFPTADACNTCSCGPTGGVACTKRACVCNPEAEPNRNYIGTPTTCQTIRYTCTSTQRSFQNDCGCGCETL